MIQTLTKNKQDEAAKLISESVGEIDPTSEYLSECEKLLSKRVVFVAEDGGQIVGIITIKEIDILPKPGRLDRKFGYVSNLFVKPEFRSKKYGDELVQAVIDHSRSHNYEKLITFAAGKYGEFFMKFGFEDENSVLVLKN